MIPTKNLGGRGEGVLGKFGGGGVIKFYSRFVKISRVGQKFSKNDIFWPNFPIFAPKFFLGGYRLSTPSPPGIMYVHDL